MALAEPLSSQRRRTKCLALCCRGSTRIEHRPNTENKGHIMCLTTNQTLMSRDPIGPSRNGYKVLEFVHYDSKPYISSIFYDFNWKFGRTYNATNRYDILTTGGVGIHMRSQQTTLNHEIHIFGNTFHFFNLTVNYTNLIHQLNLPSYRNYVVGLFETKDAWASNVLDTEFVANEATLLKLVYIPRPVIYRCRQELENLIPHPLP